MYYAALRPEEATELRRSEHHSPHRVRHHGGECGSLMLDPDPAAARPTPARSGNGSPSSTGPTGKSVACPSTPSSSRSSAPTSTSTGPTDPDGRLFVGARARRSPTAPTCGRSTEPVPKPSRAAEAASPLRAVPYALRHAAVLTWLRTTGDAALVARWTGHSVAVLLKVYAKTVDGAEQESLDRIWSATRRSTGNPPSGTPLGMDQPYVTGFSRYQPDTGSPDTKGRTP